MLKEYDETYDPTIRSKGRQAKMKRINKFFECPNHTKSSPYDLEFMLCGKEGRELYPRMLWILNIDDNELKKEIMTFCPLPRINSNAKEFLLIDECQRLLDNGDYLATELADLTTIRKETTDTDKGSEDQEMKVARGKKITKV